MYIQWNPSNPDTIEPVENVLIREVSLFQGLKCTQTWYLIGEEECVLFREGSLFQRCPYRGVPLYNYSMLHWLSCFSPQLQSLPETADNSITIRVEFNAFPAVTTPAQPVVTQTCNRILDPLTGLVAISLNYSYEYNPLIEETIVAYTVNAHELLEDGRNGAILGSFIYNPNITLTSMVFMLSLLP